MKNSTYLGVKLVKDVLQVVTLDRLLRIEKVEELLHELRCDVDLERSDLHGFIDNKLQEKLVDTLQMRPGWVHFFLLVDTSLRKVQIALLNIW